MYLLYLSVWVSAAEHLAPLRGTLLYLQEVRVHEVADVGRVEGLPVAVHSLLEELAHLTTVLKNHNIRQSRWMSKPIRVLFNNERILHFLLVFNYKIKLIY